MIQVNFDQKKMEQSDNSGELSSSLLKKINDDEEFKKLNDKQRNYVLMRMVNRVITYLDTQGIKTR